MAKITVPDTAEISDTSSQLSGFAAQILNSIESAKTRVQAMSWDGDSANAMQNFHVQLDAQARKIQSTFDDFARAVGAAAINYEDTEKVNKGMFPGS